MKKIPLFLRDACVWAGDRLLAVLPAKIAVALRERIKRKVKVSCAKSDVFLVAENLVDFRRARGGEKEPGTVAWIQTYLQKGDVVYDIGANVGVFSLLAAVQLERQCQVVAFEPSFSTYAKLVTNVVANGLQQVIFPYSFPLAENTQATEFHYQSLMPGSSLHSVGEKLDYRGRAFDPVFSKKEISFCIDDLAERFGFPVPNHLKVDVDGVEYYILAGARRVLMSGAVRSVIVEICPESERSRKIFALMAECGFHEVKKYAHAGKSSEDVQEGGVYDSVFMKQGRDA